MSDFLKADVPKDMSKWTKTGIVEGAGTPEEHTDTLYRYGNWGIEDNGNSSTEAEGPGGGGFEVYAIVDDEPIMVKGGFGTFEEAVAFLTRETDGSKRVEDAPAEAEPAPKAEKESPKEEKKTPEPPAEVKKEDESPSEPPKSEEKSEEPSFPTFKSMMQKASDSKATVKDHAHVENSVSKPYYPTVTIGDDGCDWSRITAPRTVSGKPRRKGERA